MDFPLVNGGQRCYMNAMDAELSLSDYIAKRWLALNEAEERARDEYESRLAEIRAERDQLEKAANAAGLVEADLMSESVSNIRGKKTKRRRKVASEKTIKEAVMNVLKREGRGLTALEILPRVNNLLGVDYPRTSLSPQLSRLKAEGYLQRDGIVWSLTASAHLEYQFDQLQEITDETGGLTGAQ